MSERLYGLLPTVYRQRDLAQGEPLRALMAVLERELDAVVAELDTTYDNWFVETAQAWVLPYIGDLLGVHPTRAAEAFGFSARAYLANTMRYRRRKGTAAVVEQLALDLTGFRARAVEYFQRTLTSVHVRHVRPVVQPPATGGTIDVRDPLRMERYDGPFDPQAHSIDVRSIRDGRGLYNFANLGVHVWRIGSAEVTRGTARAFAGEVGWFRFDPHGADIPLFNNPQTETEITALAQPVHVPHPVSRLRLWAEQEGALPPTHLSPDPVVGVRVQTAAGIGPALPLEICNLEDVAGAVPDHRPPAGTVAIDPQVGRLVFALADAPPAVAEPFEVLVDFSYGSAADVGAGVFDRGASHTEQAGGDAIGWTRFVTRNPTIAGEIPTVETLEEAVADWNVHAAAAPAGSVGRIVLLGGRTRPDADDIPAENRTYAAPASTIAVPEGTRLHMVAASVDLTPDGLGGFDTTVLPQRVRAVIVGDVAVVGGVAAGDQARPGGLFLNGVSIEGGIVVEPGDLERLRLAHCDVRTGGGGIEVQAAPAMTNAALQLELFRSRCGPIAADEDIAQLRLDGAVVHADADEHGTSVAVQAPGTAAVVAGSTVIGGVVVRTLSGDNAIFDGTMDVEQHQQGCLRFCYVRPGQHGPRRYRCQPDRALAGAPAGQADRIRARLRPAYVTTRFGQPGYGLLAPHAPVEIRTGAEDGSEMGAFHHLQFAVRESNFRQALRQYLRFGMDAGLLIES